MGLLNYSMQSTCRLAWGITCNRRRERSVIVCLVNFDAGGSVRGCMCVYTHTHTHTAHGVLDVSPGVRTRHLEARRIQMDEISANMYSYMCTKYTCTDISNLKHIRANRASSKAIRLFLWSNRSNINQSDSKAITLSS